MSIITFAIPTVTDRYTLANAIADALSDNAGDLFASRVTTWVNDSDHTQGANQVDFTLSGSGLTFRISPAGNNSYGYAALVILNTEGETLVTGATGSSGVRDLGGGAILLYRGKSGQNNFLLEYRQSNNTVKIKLLVAQQGANWVLGAGASGLDPTKRADGTPIAGLANYYSYLDAEDKVPLTPIFSYNPTNSIGYYDPITDWYATEKSLIGTPAIAATIAIGSRNFVVTNNNSSARLFEY